MFVILYFGIVIISIKFKMVLCLDDYVLFDLFRGEELGYYFLYIVWLSRGLDCNVEGGEIVGEEVVSVRLFYEVEGVVMGRVVEESVVKIDDDKDMVR